MNREKNGLPRGEIITILVPGDSGERADQLRFSPQGLRLNAQNLQL